MGLKCRYCKKAVGSKKRLGNHYKVNMECKIKDLEERNEQLKKERNEFENKVKKLESEKPQMIINNNNNYNINLNISNISLNFYEKPSIKNLSRENLIKLLRKMKPTKIPETFRNFLKLVYLDTPENMSFYIDIEENRFYYYYDADNIKTIGKKLPKEFTSDIMDEIVKVIHKRVILDGNLDEEIKKNFTEVKRVCNEIFTGGDSPLNPDPIITPEYLKEKEKAEFQLFKDTGRLFLKLCKKEKYRKKGKKQLDEFAKANKLSDKYLT
jgi:hypothetical protein